MKTLLTIILLTIYTVTQGQSKVDCGIVIADSNYHTPKQTNFKRSRFLILYDSLYFGVKNIVNSTNEVEIRLNAFGLPHGNYILIILTHNDSTWSVQKYFSENYGSYFKINTISLKKNKDELFQFNKIMNEHFDRLIKDEIFSLPDQNELKFEENIHDGSIYTITFKVNDKFRSYTFSNPEHHFTEYPQIKEFKKYSAIIDNLTSLF